MDEEKLILAVQRRPWLYDRANPKYSNRDYTRKAWEDVGAELGGEAEVVKKKWASLRDYFMKQLRLERDTRSRQGASKRKKWPLFENMSFLLSHTQSRELLGSLDTFSVSTDYLQQGFSEDEDASTCLSESNRSMPSPQPAMQSDHYTYSADDPNLTVSFRPPKRKASASSNSLDYIEIVKALKEQEDDDDLFFFKSLLPTMKTLRPLEKLKFRHEVQGLLLGYAERSEEANSQATP